MQLIERSHIGPSISVKFYGSNWCFSACGSGIEVYNYENGELINECRIFKRNKVHGISTFGSKLVAYGGKSISVINIQDLVEQQSLLHLEKMTREWIVSVEFGYEGDEMYLLTSYNTILILNPEFEIKATKAVYGERSLLYSGCIKVTADKVYVAAGTVMGGIIIWELFEEKYLRNLLGHEGSIFAVAFSDNAESIVSCSDDRSIKVWDRETGKLLSTGWGHMARIWNVKFYDKDKKIISVSEDCTCRLWEMKNNELQEFHCFEAHLMKNIWGVDVQNEAMIAATSGNDGRLKLLDLKINGRYGDELKVFSMHDISKHGIDIAPEEKIKGFYWFVFGMIAITSKGKVLRYKYSDDHWDVLLLDDRFSHFSITSGIQESNAIVFSNDKSLLMVLKFRATGELELKEELSVDKVLKTTNCFITKHENDIVIIVESPHPKDPLVVLRIESSNFKLLSTHYFSKPANIVLTCLAIKGNYLLLGSRYSTIAIFDFNDPNYEFTMREITPGDAITSILNVEESIFSVTNRDGYYKFIDVNFSTKSYKVLHSNKIAKGFLEGATFDNKGDYILYGFKSNVFFLYNESKQYDIGNTLCGGAHRIWKLIPDSRNGNVFCYNKASSLFINRFHESLFPNALRDGTHGREIRDISSVESNCGNDTTFIFATASEDTTLRLSEVDITTGCIRTFWTQRQHVSGLQRCSFISNKWLITSGAREELFLWEVTKTSARPYITLKSNLTVSTKSPDLRIMDFSCLFIDDSENFVLATVYSDSSIKLWFYNALENSFNMLLNGKYETCCIVNVSLIIVKDKLILLATPTDGYIVTWDITKYVPFIVENGQLRNASLEMVTLGLPVYDQRIRVHKSSIKTIDVSANEDGFYIYSGGDDNGLAITAAQLSEEGRLVFNIKCFEANAAASTITSVNLIRENSKLLVTSVDQKICLWSTNKNKLSLESDSYTTIADTGSANLITTLSDVSYALIGGVGLSFWEIKS
ncbi:HER050Wp [Eremothecium sinecaudum]|uniref:HER050Wp n=1 Tax=Eremothecium sinecaudum TaxID=45286 RepID=A0A0X8HTR5_9SACH|nr:HER050Wp [Eremothecium sinecaudum]AMD21329.1 HER050Wp [Eremothecium sinecaudum]